MPRNSPFVIELSQSERRTLETRAKKYTAPYRDVVRAKIVLMAAEGIANNVIAERLDIPRQVASKWRKRFFEHGLPGLEDRPRRGRPRVSPPEVVVAVKALACQFCVNRVFHYRGSVFPRFGLRLSRRESLPSAPRRSGVGSVRMRSVRGIIAAGSSLAILILP